MDKTIYSALLAATALVGCGGSSDGSDSGNPGPAEGVLHVETTSYNYCGIESPMAGAEVVIHHLDGRILSTAKTDSEGQLSLSWPQGGAHVSLIGEGTDQDGSAGTLVQTFVDWRSGDTIERYFPNMASKAGCHCRDVTIEANDLVSKYWDSEIRLTYQNGIFSQAQRLSERQQLNLCQSEGQWQPIDLVLDGANSTGEVLATLIEVDWDSNPTLVLAPEVFADASGVGERVTLTVNVPDYNTMTFGLTADGERVHRYYGRTWKEPYYFPGSSTRSLVSAYSHDYLDAAEFGGVTYFHLERERIEEGAATIVLPEDPSPFLNESVKLLRGMTEDAASSYDFKHFSPGKNLALVTLYDQAGPTMWQVEAPLKGTVPALELPDAVMHSLEQLSAPMLEVFLYGYNNGLNAHDYRSEIRKSEPNDPSFFDRYEYQILLLPL
ncbi:hypothetical protein [Ferrimonas gelatinilytica]|uniref:Lipoprotein n=1 Tax=Ferrimonas gelatinilytica TaxID=1255257 RepID=A0ABP9S6Z0_9GAMM